MTDRIDYNFSLSASVCDELDEIAQALEKNAYDAERDNLLLLSEAWGSEAADLFEKKYAGFLYGQRRISSNIVSASEKLRSISRRLYLLEEEAKKTVIEKGMD